MHLLAYCALGAKQRDALPVTTIFSNADLSLVPRRVLIPSTSCYNPNQKAESPVITLQRKHNGRN